jgi:hypothetical protein
MNILSWRCWFPQLGSLSCNDEGRYMWSSKERRQICYDHRNTVHNLKKSKLFLDARILTLTEWHDQRPDNGETCYLIDVTVSGMTKRRHDVAFPLLTKHCGKDCLHFSYKPISRTWIWCIMKSYQNKRVISCILGKNWLKTSLENRIQSQCSQRHVTVYSGFLIVLDCFLLTNSYRRNVPDICPEIFSAKNLTINNAWEAEQAPISKQYMQKKKVYHVQATYRYSQYVCSLSPPIILSSKTDPTPTYVPLQQDEEYWSYWLTLALLCRWATNLATKFITLLEFLNFVSEVSRLQYEWSSDRWHGWCIWKSFGVNACLQWRNVFSFHWRSVFVQFFANFSRLSLTAHAR